MVNHNNISARYNKCEFQFSASVLIVVSSTSGHFLILFKGALFYESVCMLKVI